jgi:TetR/AcrR family transcriptional regulator, transcriptional repressor for nem operon
MGRPRAFDEDEVTRAAVRLFASRAYDAISVDDLVAHLGVHRNSLYKVFGSKRGLYLAALRRHLREEVRPLLAAVSDAADPARALPELLTAVAARPELDLLLLAVAERAPVDPEVADEIAAVLRDLDATVASALGEAPPELVHALTAAVLGLRLRNRAGPGAAGAGAALLHHIKL